MIGRKIESLESQEEHLYRVLCSTKFLTMEGLGNEVPHFIYDYAPEKELQVAEMRRRLIRRLGTETSPAVAVIEIDLYRVVCNLLHGRGVMEQVLEKENTISKRDLLQLLQNLTDPARYLTPEIEELIQSHPAQVVFLTGIGKVFPYIRSHAVLNNLQTVVSDRPMVMFFPGRYEVSATQASALVLFGQVTDDSFYRAKRILDQEAN